MSLAMALDIQQREREGIVILTLVGRVLHPDGSEKLETQQSGDIAEAEPLGRRVADMLLAQGAGPWITGGYGFSEK